MFRKTKVFEIVDANNLRPRDFCGIMDLIFFSIDIIDSGKNLNLNFINKRED